MTPDLAAVCERIAQEAVALESEAKRVKDAFPLTGRSLDRRAADLRAALAAIRGMDERIDSAIAVLVAAPDPLGTEPSKRQAAAVHEANQWAWTILMEGRDPPSRRTARALAPAPAAEGEHGNG